MPKVDNATTKQAESIWRSPDGAKEIFKVTIDVGGEEFQAKTYSKDISKVGWTGSLESYEKEGKFGSETFVKQPQKEGGYGGRGNYTPKDDKAIQAMWAIGQAMNWFSNRASDKLEAKDVKELAIILNGMVDEVKTGSVDTVAEVAGDETNEDIGKEIDRVFG